MSSSSLLNIEREAAGYIKGKKAKRNQRILKIWDFVKKNISHFRAPRHEPVSSPELIESSVLTQCRSELHIDEKPGRHIIYLDTLDLAFRRANIQVRLEKKNRQKKGDLKKKFAEVTIKIGSKADSRIEEAIRINLETWEEKGFHTAFQAGIDAEVRNIQIKEKAGKVSKGTATVRRKALNSLKDEMKKALARTTNIPFKRIDPHALVHLNRDTFETEYSPCDNQDTVVEVKTDDCDWETVVQQVNGFAQIEVEHLKGSVKFFRREMAAFIEHEEFGIEETVDSKEDPAMRELEKVLLPQNDSKEEVARVEHNRKILKGLLARTKFRSINPKEAGIHLKAA